jgi:two-component system CheB/CheR fusion protein
MFAAAFPHHIIAIGASAGGLEELNTFFDHTPMDGVSYVIVQHLSSDFKSRMVQLLSRHSKLVVQEAEDGMQVISNQVYLIPSDKFLTIRGLRLYLREKGNERGPHMTINTFFNSLAADYGTKAIAVILSGLGSDGTAGVKAIKKAGGLVIARSPEGAEFHSMPSSAIASGMVDFILEPEEMPAVIDDYVRREIDLLASGIHDEQHVTEIIELINQQLPLDFSDYKQSTIIRRIKRRASSHNFDNLGTYIEFVKSNPVELVALAKDFLISVTAFFRDPEAFEFIEKSVLPGIIENLAPHEEIRLWVTGCATGEEAYSLAMLVAEQLGDKISEHDVKIFATDLDSAALAHGGRGVYKSGIAANVSKERLDRFFQVVGNEFKVDAVIRRMVIFAQHDLVKNPPYCNMHFISCRNLLIYMTPALQKKVYMMLLFGLRQEGYLFLGSSENPSPILQSLKVVNKKWKVYKNLDSNQAVRFESFSLPQILYNKPSDFVNSQTDTFKSIDRTLGDAVNETVVNDLGYLIVCIDQNQRILKFYGDTSKFLLQKILTADLTELLPSPLAIAYRTISSEVVRTNEQGIVRGIKIQQGSEIISVTMSVSPMIFKGRRNGFLVVRFSEDQLISSETNDVPVFDEQVYFTKYTVGLEQENSDLKGRLLASEEKLYSLNENMQSFNEELLSANEEMQSTNEEMQSVNEELHTINSDYQFKNKELQQLNDDLNNYFRSNINGQLFIDVEHRIMKFSPGAVKLINLQESDIGRPIGDISTNFKLETISEDARIVMDSDVVLTKEIEANNGSWYQVMTMPYLQQPDNRTTGAIITFNDITELKIIQQQLDKKNEALIRINEDLDNFVHTASHDLLAPLASIEGSISVMKLIDVKDSEMSSFLPIIDSSIKKFRSLVAEIAVVAKFENNSMITELVNVDEILDDIEWSLADRIQASNAQITRELQINKIFFSRKNLRSILFNLISNGIKYHSDIRPVINVSLALDQEKTVLSVTDNGIGMEKDHLDKIFDKYTRLHVDTEGHGIGLYLAKKIVNASGGKIIVESEPGGGSKFTIHFSGALASV